MEDWNQVKPKKKLPSVNYKLKRLKDIVKDNECIIAYANSDNYLEGGNFHRYYEVDKRWQKLNCRGLPHYINDFSMILLFNCVLVNGKIGHPYDDGEDSYSTWFGLTTKFGIEFEEFISKLDEDVGWKWVRQQILTDDRSVIILALRTTNKTEVIVYDIDSIHVQCKSRTVSPKPLRWPNVECKAVCYDKYIFMFSNTLPNENGRSLVTFEKVNVFDQSTNEWNEMETALDEDDLGPGPSARADFGWTQSLIDKRYVYMTGGHLGDGTLSASVWRLDLSTLRWFDMTSTVVFSPLCAHRVVAANTMTFVIEDTAVAMRMRTQSRPKSDPIAYAWLPPRKFRETRMNAPDPRLRRREPCYACARYHRPSAYRRMPDRCRRSDRHSHFLTCPVCSEVPPANRPGTYTYAKVGSISFSSDDGIDDICYSFDTADW